MSCNRFLKIFFAKFLAKLQFSNKLIALDFILEDI